MRKELPKDSNGIQTEGSTEVLYVISEKWVRLNINNMQKPLAVEVFRVPTCP